LSLLKRLELVQISKVLTISYPFFFNSSYVWFDKIFLDQKIISNENIFKYLIVFRKMMWKTGDRQPMVVEVWTNVSQIQNQSTWSQITMREMRKISNDLRSKLSLGLSLSNLKSFGLN